MLLLSIYLVLQKRIFLEILLILLQWVNLYPLMVSSSFRSWDAVKDFKKENFCVEQPLFDRMLDNVGPVQGSMKVGSYNVEKYHQVILLVFKNPNKFFLIFSKLLINLFFVQKDSLKYVIQNLQLVKATVHILGIFIYM